MKSELVFLLVILVGSSFLTASCATLTTPDYQIVFVKTADPGADVHLDGEYKGKTPLQVKVKPHQEYNLLVSKEGYQSVASKVEPTVSVLFAFVDIAFGIIPIFVDIATDKLWVVDNPFVDITLVPLAEGSTGASSSQTEEKGVDVNNDNVE